MDKKNTKVIGVDIGGTKIAVCLADGSGAVLASDRLTVGDYAQTIKAIAETARRLVAGQGLSLGDIPACGISAPGPLDIQRGLILETPNVGWQNVPVRDDLAAALGRPVKLENDANAGVLAEWYFGCAQGKQDVIYLTMSTGVGGGVISGGRLLTGATGNAAELGHLILDANGPMCGCGHYGCLEAYCGGRSVARRLQDMLRFHPEHAMFRLPGVDGKLENLNFQAVREGAKAGIPLALKMWDEICYRLAQGIGLCITAFNPELVVLGTAAYYAGDYMMTPVLNYLPRFAWRDFRDCCEIRLSALGLKIGELAGASVAMTMVE